MSHCQKRAISLSLWLSHSHTHTHTTPPPVGNTLAVDLCLQTVLRRTDRLSHGSWFSGWLRSRPCSPPSGPSPWKASTPGKTPPLCRSAGSAPGRWNTGALHTAHMVSSAACSQFLMFYLCLFLVLRGRKRRGGGSLRPPSRPRPQRTQHTSVGPDSPASYLKLGAFGQVHCSRKLVFPFLPPLISTVDLPVR